MRKYIFVIVSAIILAHGGTARADAQGDRAVVPLSRPGQPATIHVEVLAGSITVTGYDGNEVIVEAAARGQKIGGDEKSGGKYAGMKRVSPVSGTGLEVTEENNEVEVSVESWKVTIDVTLKVPARSSLELHTVNGGDIAVENISGEIDAGNVNGGIKLSGVAGSVVASTTNGPVQVTFTKVDAQKPMSFASFNGDVDVTFPSDLKANVKLKTEQGEIYSDFEIATTEGPRKVEEKEGKRYVIRFDRTVYGKINGGGQEMSFSTFNGDILIRRSK
ncbi:MAG: DUF4097 family beta strand repeat-containing protein [Acidobacteriota bacterium]